MLNNENSLDHSPSKQLCILKKKIDLQAQKSHSYDQKIKDLQAKIQAAKKRTQQKRQILTQTQQKITEQRQKGQHSNSSSQGLQSNSQSTSIASSAILEQLRQHFKALRHQMLREDWSDEDDDEYYDEVDVDNMTYEELLELGQKIGKVSKGLDLKKMGSLHVKKYKNPNPNEPFEYLFGYFSCAICRDQLQDGADCIELQCQHVFHDECIKGWLNVEKHCPNCKREIKIGAQLSEKIKNDN